MKVCIIGAGASGLMAGGFIAEKGHQVVIFDGNEKAGKKIYITGKGRCNFTNASTGEDFNINIINGNKFLLSSFKKWDSFDTINFFESLGVKTKIERGNRAFPLSDKSSDIIKALLKHCQNCQFKYNEKIKSVNKKDDFIVITEKNKYHFDAVIIATGGKSYPLTGSTGDGYKFAEIFGHNIVDLKPGLVPILIKDNLSQLEGVSLKNVKLKVLSGKKEFSEFGEMMFTDRGITGPIVLSMSSKINELDHFKIYIDFKPALSEEKLNSRFLREFEQSKNKNISNVLNSLLPKSMVFPFLSRCEIDGLKKVNSITLEERRKMIFNLKNFELCFDGFYPIDVAIITSGGVNLNEINPKNMESKLIPNLYFIGEVLNLDALTGGYNLQIAFSTAVACADSF